MKGHCRQAGIALVMVIWFIALLSLLALGFSKVMRSEALVARNLVESTRATHLAKAAIEQGIYGLLKQDPVAVRAMISGVPIDSDIGDAKLSYKLQDENGKLDINHAPVELIENLLLSLGLSETTALSISHAVEDWRDEDALKLPFGAETRDYTELNMLWKPSNAPFRNIHEIRHVMGITADIYKMIAPLITVYSASDRINPKFASPVLLGAIPGIDIPELENYIDARASLMDDDNPDVLPMLTSVESSLSEQTGPVYSIFGRAELPSGTVATRSLVVWLSNETLEHPYFILDSGDDDPSPNSGKDAQ